MLRSALLCLFATAAVPVTFAAKNCYTPEEAPSHIGKNVCIHAHIYDVQTASDNTRSLQVCKDDACKFTIVNLPQDRSGVGSLDALRDKDIDIRGTIHSLGNTSVILFSMERQLHGGDEKFRPNPALLSGFSAADDKGPIKAQSNGRHHGTSVFGGANH